MSHNLIDVVILRHGEADNATPDNARSLTERGRSQVASQCKWLTEQGFSPELILHSPYQRTTETAEIAKTVFSDDSPSDSLLELQVEPLITPDGNPAMVSELIPVLEKRRILLASHMPMVSYLTATLLPDGDLFGYPVAGLCWIQLCLDEPQKTRLLHKHWPSN